MKQSPESACTSALASGTLLDASSPLTSIVEPPHAATMAAAARLPTHIVTRPLVRIVLGPKHVAGYQGGRACPPLSVRSARRRVPRHDRRVVIDCVGAPQRQASPWLTRSERAFLDPARA